MTGEKGRSFIEVSWFCIPRMQRINEATPKSYSIRSSLVPCMDLRQFVVSAVNGFSVHYKQDVLQIMPTSQYDTVEDAIAAFLRLSGEQGDVISSGALACAGPVVDNVCDMTNLKWVVDGDAIAKRFGMRTAVTPTFLPASTCLLLTYICLFLSRCRGSAAPMPHAVA